MATPQIVYLLKTDRLVRIIILFDHPGATLDQVSQETVHLCLDIDLQ